MKFKQRRPGLVTLQWGTQCALEACAAFSFLFTTYCDLNLRPLRFVPAFPKAFWRGVPVLSLTCWCSFVIVVAMATSWKTCGCGKHWLLRSEWKKVKATGILALKSREHLKHRPASELPERDYLSTCRHFLVPAADHASARLYCTPAPDPALPKSSFAASQCVSSCCAIAY